MKEAPPKICPRCAAPRDVSNLAVCPACGRRLSAAPAAPPAGPARGRVPPRRPQAPKPSAHRPEIEPVDAWLPRPYAPAAPPVCAPPVRGPQAAAPAASQPDPPASDLLAADPPPDLADSPWRRWEAERSGERGRFEKNAVLLVGGLAALLCVAGLLLWLS